jgi:hypothetical protein
MDLDEARDVLPLLIARAEAHGDTAMVRWLMRLKMMLDRMKTEAGRRAA